MSLQIYKFIDGRRHRTGWDFPSYYECNSLSTIMEPTLHSLNDFLLNR